MGESGLLGQIRGVNQSYGSAKLCSRLTKDAHLPKLLRGASLPKTRWR
jgi:hypothetical protein